MRRCATVVAVLCLAISVFAQDQRTIKRDLMRELLNVIDTKTLMQGSLDIVFHEMERSVPMGELKAFRERLYTRIDYAKYAEEVYGPIFDKNFTATEAYATDENKYPNAKTYAELAPILSPIYVKKMPEKDVWGTPYLYVVSSDQQRYRFVSAGADRKFDWNAEQIEVLPSGFKGRTMDNLDADIIFQDGMFVQFPAVSQSSRTSLRFVSERASPVIRSEYSRLCERLRISPGFQSLGCSARSST